MPETRVHSQCHEFTEAHMVEMSNHLLGFCQMRLAHVQVQCLKSFWLEAYLMMEVFVFAVQAYVENSFPW